MTVVNNILAMNAQRQFKIAGKKKTKTSEKLASGYRINRAADDAAGLAISEKMRRQIRGLTQGVNNCQEGISLCQVADGAMAEVHDMIQRMNELCIQAANGTNTDSDREAIDQEIQQIKKEIDRVGNETLFNEIKVLQGTKKLGTTIVERTDTIIEYELRKIEKIIDAKVYDWRNGKNPYVKEYFGVESGEQRAFPTEWVTSEKAYQAYYNLDFSKVNSNEAWNNLNGAGFQFTCTQGCGQKFSFIFDNTMDTIIDLTPNAIIGDRGEENSKVFLVGTQKYQNGSEFVDDMLKALSEISITTSRGVACGHANSVQTVTGEDIKVVGVLYNYDPTQNGHGRFTVGVPYYSIYKKEVEELMPIEKQIKYTEEIAIYEMKDIFIQYGAKANEYFKVRLPHIDCEALEMTDVAGNPVEKALESIKILSNALQKVSEERSRMGAYTNGLEHLVAAESNTVENTTAAESVIRDYDMAKGMVEHSNHNILEQVGTAMIAQANHINENVLNLLQ